MTRPVVHLRKLDPPGWSRYAAPVAEIERASFSPASRDSLESMRSMVEHPRGVCYVALRGGEVAGYCLGAPLELFGHLRGVDRDPGFGAGDCCHAAILAVAPAHRGLGVASRLKRAQIVGARALGYRRLTGRNRRGLGRAMWHVNRRLGARGLGLVRDAYSDGPEPRECIYYEIDLIAYADAVPARAARAPAPTVAAPA